MSKIFTVTLLLLITHFGATAQVVPNIKLSTLNGESFDSQQLNQITAKPVVLLFWATWCVPCLNELTAINDSLDDWKNETKFDLYAISEDDSRTTKRVPALVNGKGWKFNVLLDNNQDFKRELNFSNIPYTIVLKNGKIIYRHAGYVAGNENELFKIIKENQ
jgi:thiol-disulfide isomerase/thioredoxin